MVHSVSGYGSSTGYTGRSESKGNADHVENRDSSSSSTESDYQRGRRGGEEERNGSSQYDGEPQGGLDGRTQFAVTQGLHNKNVKSEDSDAPEDTEESGGGGKCHGGGAEGADEVEESDGAEDADEVEENDDTEGADEVGENDDTEGADGRINISANNLAVTPATGGDDSTPSPTGNQDMDRWDTQIEAAAKATGLPANYIKATIWAESRGNPDDPSQNPDGQHTDEGVMQISDYTYGDVMNSQPNAPRGLTAGNPADNIMMGAWELKDKMEKAGGDLHATSMAYVGHGDETDSVYADNVMMYMNELANGQPLTDN